MNNKDWLVCRIASRHCALPLESVCEVMRPQPLTPVRTEIPSVMGVARIRSAVTPVINGGQLLFGYAIEAKRFVTLAVGDRAVGLAVDDVVGVAHLDEELELQLPPILSDRFDALAAVAIQDEQLWFVLGGCRWLPQSLWNASAEAGGNG